MARVLITGGAGFIGSHTAERLSACGHHVTVIDDFSSGARANLATAFGDMAVVVADVRDAAAMAAVCSRQAYDAVIHLAAIASVTASVRDPLGSQAVNLGGVASVLEAARQAGIRRVVLASSAAVYGSAPALPCDERALPAPCSPYAAQKAAAELLGAAYRSAFGMETVALRYFNVYGPRQPSGSPYSGLIAQAAARLRAGEMLTIDGDGEQTRDFIHVQDVATVNERAALGPYPGPEPINVATGVATSVLGTVALIRQVLRVDAELRFGPPRPGDIRHSRAAVERLRDRTGYQAATPLGYGLAELLAALS